MQRNMEFSYLGRGVLATVCSLAVLILSACAPMIEVERESTKNYEDAVKRIGERDESDSKPYRVMNVPWVDTTPVGSSLAVGDGKLTPPSARSGLPPEKDCLVSFASSPTAKITVNEFAQSMTAQCHLPVYVDLRRGLMTGGAGAVLPGSLPTPLPSAGPGAAGRLPPLPPGGIPGPQVVRAATMSANTQYAAIPEVRGVRWDRKPMSGLFDLVTASLSLNWRYQDGAIYIRDLETKTFPVMALAIARQVESTIKVADTTTSNGAVGSPGGSSSVGTNSTQSGQGGTTQEVKTSYAISAQKELEATLSQLVTPGVGNWNVLMNTASVVVTDTAPALARIAAVLQQQNERTSRHGMLYVTVATITLNKSDDRGINWQAVFQNLSNKFGMTLTNAFTAPTGSSTASFGVPKNATGGWGQWAGSQAVLDALAEQGTVSITKQNNVLAMHMNAAPINDSLEQEYVCGMTLASVAQVGTTTGVNICKVTTGFAMNLLPNFLDNQRLLLGLSLQMSPPAVITTNTLGETFAQTSTVQRQAFERTLPLRSGETVLVSDYQNKELQSDLKGTVDPKFWPLGGQGSNSTRKQVLVILITPVIDTESFVPKQSDL